MTQRFLVPATLAATLLAALSAPATALDWYGLRPFAGGGITYGGSKIATVEFRNGDTQDLHAGSLAEIQVGLDYRLIDRVSLQTSIAYQADASDGRNGHLLFSRYPFELLAHYHATPHFRFGGGVRYAINPQLTGGGVLSDQGVDFHSRLGVVIEGEYLLMGDNVPSVGFKLRGVSEEYKAEPGGQSFSGDHVGFLVSYYF